jgi:hypothetical protein
LFDNFGAFSSRELELRATIIYYDRHPAAGEKETSIEEFVSIIHEIKPGFSMREIEIAIQELENRTYIQPWQ